MSSNKRKKVGWGLTGILGALFIMSGTMKLISGPDSEMAKNFVKWGLEGKLPLIAGGELVATLLFLIPNTFPLGLLLLSAHMGGAIATHMEHGESFALQSAFLVLLWITAWLRRPQIFSGTGTAN